MKKIILSVLTVCAGLAVHAQNGPVKAWEGTIDLPTYRVDAPEKAPSFSRDFAHQRAKRGVYPYPMNDNCTYVKVDSTHKALYMENDYIKMCVLPGIGGRLFYATDKTNGYEIFYRQHVIKPCNVGMTGAWISGGVEWNTFHHHRQTSQLPVDYRIVDNGDGSKTIWVGEVEKRQRMSWAIGMTLHPDKSYIEITGRLINGTSDANSILHWSNVATHCNENYQIIFPENTDFGMFHAKNSFMRWPVADAPYCNNADYIGRDISFWRNMPNGNSVFVYDLQDDYIGGYDHGKDAGTMLVGDRNICKGGKFWTWGPKAYGHMWDCISLTDNDGPYVELMTAAYSDNQPDYCWINPYEVKEFRNYWYGIRDLDHVNRGNKWATVNMDIKEDGNIHLAANVTEIRRNARVTVTGKDGALLWETVTYIAPDKPFETNIKVPAEAVAKKADVTMRVYAADGQELISYHPYELDRTKPLPEPFKPLPKPQDIKDIEEVYYAGMRVLQFHNAHVDPNDYFLEVIKRDPKDTRANTQMGIYHRKRGEYAEAKKYLRTALERQTANYTRVADGEAMYNLGLILKAEGAYDAAVDTLSRAAWDYEFASPAYYNLAQIASLRGDSEKALQHTDLSVRYNAMNFEAQNLKATLLRKAGRKAEAARVVNEILEMNPLNWYATREAVRLGLKNQSELTALMRNVSESYLELANYYLNNGFPEEGISILKEADGMADYATIRYYLGYLADAAGDRKAAADWFAKAEAASTDYVFPFRLETVKVYEKALEYIPQSATTWNYLGTLLFDKQPDKAMAAWEKVLSIDPVHSMALRNLGWAYRHHVEDFAKSAEYYDKAVACDTTGDSMLLEEADEIYALTNAPLQKRYDMLMSHADVAAKRYGTFTRKIKQMVLHGDYDAALADLKGNFFSRCEHVDDLHDVYVDACLLAGLKKMDEGYYEKALEYMLMADEYPANMFYARLEWWARNAQVHYMIGCAYEKCGNMEKAREHWQKAADYNVKDTNFAYEKGLAMKKLDPKADVKPMYRALVKKGKSSVTDYVERFFIGFDRGDYPEDVNARAYYTAAIGYKALGRDRMAARYFKKSLEQRNENVWANHYLGL